MDQASFYCPRCQQMRLFQSQGMNHTAHILASVFLCGLWLPIWIIMAIADSPQYHCAFCGFTDAHKYLANPRLRQSEAHARAQRDAERAARIEARGELTFQEKIVYLISDHKDYAVLLAIIAGILIAVAVMCSISGRR